MSQTQRFWQDFGSGSGSSPKLNYVDQTSGVHDYSWEYPLPPINGNVTQSLLFGARRRYPTAIDVEYCVNTENTNGQTVNMCVKLEQYFARDSVVDNYRCCPDRWGVGGFTYQDWNATYSNFCRNLSSYKPQARAGYHHCMFFRGLQSAPEYKHKLTALKDTKIPILETGFRDTLTSQSYNMVYLMALLQVLTNSPAVYCCEELCPSLVSSLGSSLGYAAYIEAIVTLVVLLVYIFAVQTPFIDSEGGLGISLTSKLKLAAGVAVNLSNEKDEKEDSLEMKERSSGVDTRSSSIK